MKKVIETSKYVIVKKPAQTPDQKPAANVNKPLARDMGNIAPTPPTPPATW